MPVFYLGFIGLATVNFRAAENRAGNYPKFGKTLGPRWPDLHDNQASLCGIFYAHET
jgi:hypothetical protein